MYFSVARKSEHDTVVSPMPMPTVPIRILLSNFMLFLFLSLRKVCYKLMVIPSV